MQQVNKYLLFAFCFCTLGATAQKGSTDSATRPASYQYMKTTFFRTLFSGINYRKVWEMPVTAPVLYLSQQGFTVIELGGGQQTKSLQLKDAQGRNWALRSIEKDASGLLLPKGVPRRLAVPILQDMTSASFPYAPIVVYEISKVAGLPSYPPALVYVGDDKQLGPYRSLFSGTLCFLELRSIVGEEKTTEELINVLENNDQSKVLERQVLKARLLDMLIADWDRHAEQWRWGVKDSAGSSYFFVIPRDRDQAFFKSDGLLVKLAGMFGAKQFVGFKKSRLKLERLNLKSWEFDHIFLSSLAEEAWKEEIVHFQQLITDRVIEAAVAKLPWPVYRQWGSKISATLKCRRDALLQEGLKYYRTVSREVFIQSSARGRNFVIESNNKNVVVTVTDKAGRMVYKRMFDFRITNQITLALTGNNDVIVDRRNKESKIKLSIKKGQVLTPLLRGK